MNSQKCFNCGFTNFADVDVCKKCKENLQSQNQSGSFKKLPQCCPHCSSNDIQSFQMAYQTGTSHGVIQNTSYNYEIGASVSTAKVSNQTILAGKIGPPVEPKNFTLAVSFLFLFVTWAFVIFFGEKANATSKEMFLFAVVCTVLEIPFIFIFDRRWTKEIKGKQIEYKSAMAKWLRSWICLRCGSNWQI